MPMRISLALGPRQPLSRQTAWGCLTANLALPGAGSLVAGRLSGYPQAALALGGMALTVLSSVRLCTWYVANWARFWGPAADPTGLLADLWPALRWPLLSLAIFALGWLWALATSLALLRAAKNAERPTVPPRLR